eukprot:6191999-Pleurochrysis_carterae.AAC.3
MTHTHRKKPHAPALLAHAFAQTRVLLIPISLLALLFPIASRASTRRARFVRESICPCLGDAEHPLRAVGSPYMLTWHRGRKATTDTNWQKLSPQFVALMPCED